LTVLRNRSRRSGGFTLIELAAVIVILALLAGVVAVSVRAHLENAKLELLLARVEAFDGRLRDETRRQNRLEELRINAQEGCIAQGEATSPPRVIRVTGRIRIDRIRTTDFDGEFGELRVLISPLGQSDTYALRFRTAQGRQVWLVVLGVSGQCLRLEKEEQVDEVFALS